MIFSSFDFGIVPSIVSQLLPADYMIGQDDIEWLLLVQKEFQTPKYNLSRNASERPKQLLKDSRVEIVRAVNATIKKYKDTNKMHIDPWELFIDAGICDTKCKPI